MQWLLGLWHANAWENWVKVWWRERSSGKQRKGCLFSLSRKGLNQTELSQACQGSQWSGTPKCLLLIWLTYAQIKSVRKSSKWWVLLFFSPCLASNKKMPGLHHTPGSPAVKTMLLLIGCCSLFQGRGKPEISFLSYSWIFVDILKHYYHP